jgi:predicted membrane protein
VLFGAALLIKNLGFMPDLLKRVIFSWEALLMVIGIISMFGRGVVFGVILFFVGGFFMASHVIGFSFNFHQVFWPTIIIAGGLGMLAFSRRHFHPKYKIDSKELSEDFLDESTVFGGSERTIHSKNFSGGKLTCIFGGGKYNFNNSQLAEGNNVLELTAVFGGGQLIVPPDWNIKIEITSIFGGVADKRAYIANQANSSKVLVLRGSAVFGGLEIKSI